MRKIKLFEKFIGEGEEVQELDEIFTSLDLDYDVEVLVFPRNDVKDTKVYTVSLTFESKAPVKEQLEDIWSRIKMARKLGFNSYGKLYKLIDPYFGQIEYGNFSEDHRHKIKIDERIFTSDKVIDNIGGLYIKKIHSDLDPYQRFDKFYSIINVTLHFEGV